MTEHHEAITDSFDALELLSGGAFTWRVGRNYVKLEPGQAHIVKVTT